MGRVREDVHGLTPSPPPNIPRPGDAKPGSKEVRVFGVMKHIVTKKLSKLARVRQRQRRRYARSILRGGPTQDREGLELVAEVVLAARRPSPESRGASPPRYRSVNSPAERWRKEVP